MRYYTLTAKNLAANVKLRGWPGFIGQSLSNERLDLAQETHRPNLCYETTNETEREHTCELYLKTRQPKLGGLYI